MPISEKPHSKDEKANTDVADVTGEDDDQKYAVFNHVRPTKCESHTKKRNR